MADDDPEVHLAAGDWRATVAPFGASLRSLWLEPRDQPRRDVLWGYADRAMKKGGQGDVLAPWPGRIADATYTFNGTQHRLPKNDKDGPNAIHGFLRSRLWEVEHDAATARFRTRIRASEHAGYPFDLEVGLGYELDRNGLACAFVVRNLGDGPAPFGIGFHPYILARMTVDATILRAPASQVVEFAGLLPTGKVVDVPPELDFRTARAIGATRLNHCLTGMKTDPDGFTRVHVDDVVLWMDRNYPYVVLYSGDTLGPDARRSLAVEPMSCATDAFNHPAWGLRVLEPGAAMAGTWGIGMRPSGAA